MFGGFALFLWWRWVRDELDRSGGADEAPAADEAVEPAEIASSS